MHWQIELKFCIWLCCTVLQIKFECLSIWVNFCGSNAPFGTRILEVHGVSHFSLACIDILSWNFVYYFVLLYYRSSLSVVNLRQILLELCHFWNLKYVKYTVFRTFLLHALAYWAENLHMTLFYCTWDQVWVSSICVDFCGSYALLELRILEVHSFPPLFSFMLWHNELKFYIWLIFTALQIKFECR